MNFVEKVAAYSLGLFDPKDLPDMAITAMEEGYESESLHILAGMNASDNPFELHDYFQKALSALGLIQPIGKEALVFTVNSHVKEIVNLQKKPYDEFKNIIRIVRASTFYYDDIMLLDCYGLYIAIDELDADWFSDSSGKTMAAYSHELEASLVSNVKIWQSQFDYLI